MRDAARTTPTAEREYSLRLVHDVTMELPHRRVVLPRWISACLRNNSAEAMEVITVTCALRVSAATFHYINRRRVRRRLDRIAHPLHHRVVVIKYVWLSSAKN